MKVKCEMSDEYYKCALGCARTIHENRHRLKFCSVLGHLSEIPKVLVSHGKFVKMFH